MKSVDVTLELSFEELYDLCKALEIQINTIRNRIHLASGAEPKIIEDLEAKRARLESLRLKCACAALLNHEIRFRSLT
jgi:hypothetical protein